jgi:hypothetical protein
MNAQQKAAFLDLACQLSPENLCCDGELPLSLVRKRYKSLTAQWKKLEKEVGRKVSETELWTCN